MRIAVAAAMVAAVMTVSQMVAHADPAAERGSHMVTYTVVAQSDSTPKDLLSGDRSAEPGRLRRRLVEIPDERESAAAAECFRGSCRAHCRRPHPVGVGQRQRGAADPAELPLRDRRRQCGRRAVRRRQGARRAHCAFRMSCRQIRTPRHRCPRGRPAGRAPTCPTPCC